ncbi:fimbria/pilus outer membrane usher protein [Vibrio sp. ZSDZ65]|uniref:Fimbria/pilus outer membrane usher protein n=1 Tax=Vibrio qingdaonensis TaxID=2829491 RepID=A0A9X3HWQ1_9VIBR|nr:fimbria/pilus outer membrane usher protein [Vibrio qingdaonensis]MCW8346448.1 fimbria/pilus outer membrane usher protein [Vibrio qingdaonensis]
MKNHQFLRFIPLLLSYQVSGSEFDLSFMNSDISGKKLDMRWFEQAIAPGEHMIDVELNKQSTQRMLIEFKLNDTNVLQPCLSKVDVLDLNIKTPAVAKDCYTVEDISPMATANYISSQSLLILSIPDVNIDKSDGKLKTLPSKWDQGVNSVKLNYNSYINGASNSSNINGYLGIQALATFGMWRLKGGGNVYKNGHIFSSNLSDFYVYRDIDSITSRASFGEIRSGSISAINGSLPLTGLNLLNASRMYKSHWNNYVPILKDIALSSAKVTVLQSGRVLYSRVVSPGEFEISDLDVSSTGADLELVIEESNGQIRRRTIPFTKLPSLLREGRFNYSVSAGQYRNSNASIEPAVLTGGFEYGLGVITPKFSTLLSERYYYGELGVTYDLGRLGAMSFESGATRYTSFDDHKQYNGFILKSLYAKQFYRSATSLQLVGYQYRSPDFLSFEEYISTANEVDGNHKTRLGLRNRFEVSVNQPISEASLYLSYKYDTYHNSSLNGTSLYSSLNFNLGRISVGLNYTISDTVQANYGVNSDRRIGLSLSLPFGKSNDSNVLFSSTHEQNTNTLSNRLSYSGKTGNYDYSATVNQTSNDTNTDSRSVSAMVRHSTSYGQFSANVESRSETTAGSLSANGGLLIYKGGVVATQYLGETTAVVKVKDAENLVINHNPTLKTNKNGIAVIPYSNDYGSNRIHVNAEGNSDVQLVEFSKTYIPRRGSTVFVDLKARVGKRVLVKLNTSKNLFGEHVVSQDNQSDEVSFVGTDNIVYLSGIRPNQSTAFVVGDGLCEFSINVSPNSKSLQDIIELSCN